MIGLVPFAMFIAAHPPKRIGIAINRRIWYTLTAVGNVMALLSFFAITPDAGVGCADSGAGD